MALLAEEIVEEWLNRQGYFTIRGIKLGVHEIDILAIKPDADGKNICRHIEVQASVHPISYISSLTKETRKRTGRGPGSAKKRSPEELTGGIDEWIEKKFHKPEKKKLRNNLYNGDWSYELGAFRVRPGQWTIAS